ncbi:MAG: hypothetical protein ACE5KF_11580 [Kiloniellaceae bacterium]
MKAFISGTAAAIVIAILAWVVLNAAGMSSAEMFSTGNVRL